MLVDVGPTTERISLDGAETGEDLFRPFQFSRPEGEYATIDQVVDHLEKNFDRTEHIYTESLNVNGRAVQDHVSKYLLSPAYSSSALKWALKSPFHLHYYRESGQREELERYQKRSAAFHLGEFIHAAILEPTKFSRVVTEPADCPRNTHEGCDKLIEFWQNVILVLPDTPIPRMSDFDLDKVSGKRAYIDAMIENAQVAVVSEKDKLIIDILHANYLRYGGGILPRLIKHSKREISLYGTDEETGLDVRVRPDAMAFAENIGVNAIISIKSGSQETIDEFIRRSVQYKYHLTEGMYQSVASQVTGRDFNATISIFFQTVPPFGIAAFFWNPKDIELGKYLYRQALSVAAECEVSGYPMYDVFAEEGHYGLIPMQLPNYAHNEAFEINMAT